MDHNAKLQLTELINRPELNNKFCADCGGLNPQWCSLTHAIFLCLSCAGVHRGFGVHISFVRSISMDTFSEEQLRRMKLGGNAPFLEFLQSYSPDTGGYSPSLSIYDKYHCWAAAQHREKLTATLDGRPWSPSPPPPQAQNDSDTSQNLRKSRTTGRNISQSTTPARSSSPYADEPHDQKAANEAYFNTLGAANAARPSDLPPSQGGRYAGFGNTPSPRTSSTHPSFGLSSAAAPTLADIQADPLGALGKGWSLFSSAVVGATKAVNENVIQPSVEKVSDPNFRNGVVQTMSNTAKSANQWSKTQLGVDVGGILGSATSSTSSRGAYTALDAHDADQYGVDHSALYSDSGKDDFFSDSLNEPPARDTRLSSTVTQPSKSVPAVHTKKDEWQEDEWKDF